MTLLANQRREMMEESIAMLSLQRERLAQPAEIPRLETPPLPVVAAPHAHFDTPRSRDSTPRALLTPSASRTSVPPRGLGDSMYATPQKDMTMKAHQHRLNKLLATSSNTVNVPDTTDSDSHSHSHSHSHHARPRFTTPTTPSRFRSESPAALRLAEVEDDWCPTPQRLLWPAPNAHHGKLESESELEPRRSQERRFVDRCEPWLRGSSSGPSQSVISALEDEDTSEACRERYVQQEASHQHSINTILDAIQSERERPQDHSYPYSISSDLCSDKTQTPRANTAELTPHYDVRDSLHHLVEIAYENIMASSLNRNQQCILQRLEDERRKVPVYLAPESKMLDFLLARYIAVSYK